MRCPQSGNGCPLFVFLRRFVFFLSKRKKVFKKFKKSFEKAEEAPPAGRGRGGFRGRASGGVFCKKAPSFAGIQKKGAGARQASVAPRRQPLQGRCRKRPARQEASPAAFTAGPRPRGGRPAGRPGGAAPARGGRPAGRPGRLRRAAAPRLRAPPAPRRRYRRLPRCGRKTPASRGRRPP